MSFGEIADKNGVHGKLIEKQVKKKSIFPFMVYDETINATCFAWKSAKKPVSWESEKKNIIEMNFKCKTCYYAE